MVEVLTDSNNTENLIDSRFHLHRINSSVYLILKIFEYVAVGLHAVVDLYLNLL